MPNSHIDLSAVIYTPSQLFFSRMKNQTEITSLTFVLLEVARKCQLSLVTVLNNFISQRYAIANGDSSTDGWVPLKALEIDEFKALKSIVVPLGEVTILVGPNGSGKSSVLQATHWAARAASYITPKNTKEVVGFERLDYSPSSKPLSTANNGELGSVRTQTHTRVSYIHKSPFKVAHQSATVKIWAARNKGAISVHIEGGTAVTPFKQREKFLTAYIPGLAGLAEKETILARPLMRRNAASGDAGGVLRNVLYNLATSQNAEAPAAPIARLQHLNKFLQKIHSNYQIAVNFDEREDIHIDASYIQIDKPEFSHPLEDLATGVLQVIQIFAYLILFRPKLLLVDEPDAHLHPDKQERLIEALESAAREFRTQIIITTHSQHVVRAASEVTQLVWLDKGEVKSQDEKAVRTLMGWGALDKKVIFFVEDEEDYALRSIIRQWPEIQRQISICKCFGLTNLPSSRLLDGLDEQGDISVSAVLHRDRDFMTEAECALWAGKFTARNTFCWSTEGCDVEAYFCRADYISALYRIPLADAESYIAEAVQSIAGAKQLFKDKRKEIQRTLYPDGGSPNSEQMWSDLGERTPHTVLGKKLHKALKSVVNTKKLDAGLLNKFIIPADYSMAPDLHRVLASAIKAQTPRVTS